MKAEVNVDQKNMWKWMRISAKWNRKEKTIWPELDSEASRLNITSSISLEKLMKNNKSNTPGFQVRENYSSKNKGSNLSCVCFLSRQMLARF